MPPKKRRGRKRPGSSPAVAGVDRLGALPDGVLHHVLSFLRAEEAVQTCVLARRWRHLWKSATGLRVVHGDLDGPESVKPVRNLVDHVLLLRGRAPLDTCEICLADLGDDDMSRVKLWIRHILMCKVRVLGLDILVDSCPADLNGLTLVSNHLKKLQLSYIQFDKKLCDFSCCPVLEVLKIDNCDLSRADRISLQSVKFLSITKCCFDVRSRTHIFAPNLHSLRFEVGYLRAPVLERMPSLVDAFVNLSATVICDCCENSLSGDCENHDCSACYDLVGDTDNCVVLQGLSEAQHLVLLSYVGIYIFRRDLKWCPIFGNLKSLLLNEYWCVPDDFSALTYMLEHSPILEKLTLRLFSKENNSNFEVEGKPDPTKRSAAVSEHLKTVEVKCDVVDSEVFAVLNFLSKLGIYMSKFSP